MRDDDLLRYVEDNTLITREELNSLVRDIRCAILAINVLLSEAGILKSEDHWQEVVASAAKVVDKRP